MGQIEAVIDNDIRRPMALVGPARVGKSHLLRLIAARLRARAERPLDLVVEVLLTPTYQDARDVLRAMFSECYGAFTNTVCQRGIGDPEVSVLEPVDVIVHLLSEAVAGTASEITLSEVQSIHRAIGSSREIKAKIPLLAGHLGVGLGSHRQTSTTDTTGRTIKIKQLEAVHFADLVSLIHMLVRQHEPEWTTLLVIDDFDLLHRSSSGEFEPEQLLGSLASMARIPGLHVLTTVRQDTYRRHEKVLHRVVHVAPFAEEQHLVEIYRRHVDLYFDGNDPFRGSFVEAAAQRTGRRPGIFLKHMREAFQILGPKARELEFHQWIHESWERAKQEEPEVAEIIERAIERNRGFIPAKELATVQRSSLTFWTVNEYTSETTNRVDPALQATLTISDNLAPLDTEESR